MTNSNYPTTQVDQSNIYGDNIEKQYVYNTVSAEHLSPTVHGVMDLIRVRNFEAAKHQIDALSSISAKNADIEAMLPLLHIQLDLASQKRNPSYLQKIYANKKLISDPVFLDILDAIAITAESMMSGEDTALEYYSAISSPGTWAINAFYEHVANTEQLVARSNEGSFKTDEFAVCAVVRGLFLRGGADLSVELAGLQAARFPSFNSRVLSLLTIFRQFGEKVGTCHIWLLKGSDYKKFNSIISEAIELLDICKGQDFRVVHLTANLLEITFDSAPRLFKTCCKYAGYYEEKHPRVYSALRQDKDLEDSQEKRSSEVYSQQVVENAPLSLDEFAGLYSLQGKDKLTDWYKGGGYIKAQNDIDKRFYDIYLLAVLGDPGWVSDSEIRTKTNEFHELFESKIQELNPFQLHQLTESLIERGLHDLAFLFLDSLFDVTDIWLSPLCVNYLNSLVATNKNSTLDTLFKNLLDEDLDEFLLLCKSNYLKGINEIPRALLCLKQAIALNPNSLQAWHYLIGLYVTHIDDEVEYKSVLSEIPQSIFENFSEQAIPLVYEILNKGNPQVAEAVLIRWFIQAPDQLAKHVTNIRLNQAKNRKINSRETVVENCLGGFKYKLGSKEYIKLITTGESIHNCLLNSNTLLAQQILSMSVGEETTFQLNKLTLVEIIPAFPCCVQIGYSLRAESNDDNDYFISIEMPTDKAMLIPAMEEMFRSLENEESHSQKYLKTKDVPLFSKCLFTNKICPMEIAVAHLSHPEVEKIPFTNIGIEDSEQVLLDVYSIAYLGLSGLIHGLIAQKKSLAITVETKNALIAYLDQVESPDYLVAGLEGGKFARTTSSEILIQTIDIRHAINYVLDIAEIPIINKVDLPQELLQLNSMLDYSVFSTVKLAFANTIPWVCIDGIYHGLFNQSGINVVSNSQFFGDIGSFTSLKDKLGGLVRSGTSSFPFVLLYSDLGDLASSNLKDAHYVLSEILGKQKSVHMEAKKSLIILSKLASDALVRALEQRQFLNGLRKYSAGNDGLAEKIFNICSSLAIRIPGWTAEVKFAAFYVAVKHHLNQNNQALKVVNYLAMRFIEGHFLFKDEIMAEIEKIDLGEISSESILAKKEEQIEIST